ncbi:uncharacterized protein O8D03_014966 [Erethizon dorsatum]
MVTGGTDGLPETRQKTERRGTELCRGTGPGGTEQNELLGGRRMVTLGPPMCCSGVTMCPGGILLGLTRRVGDTTRDPRISEHIIMVFQKRNTSWYSCANNEEYK